MREIIKCCLDAKRSEYSFRCPFCGCNVVVCYCNVLVNGEKELGCCIFHTNHERPEDYGMTCDDMKDFVNKKVGFGLDFYAELSEYVKKSGTKRYSMNYI